MELKSRSLLAITMIVMMTHCHHQQRTIFIESTNNCSPEKHHNILDLVTWRMEELFHISDLIHEVSIHLPLRDRYEFALTTKTAWAGRLFHGDHTGKYSQFQLKIEQQEVLAQLEESNDRFVFIKAPASFGKTPSMWIHLLAGIEPPRPEQPLPAVPAEQRILLIVPYKCVRLWTDQLLKLFPYCLDTDPQRSMIGVDDASRMKHYAITKQGTVLPHWRVLLTTASRIRQRYHLAGNTFTFHDTHFRTTVIDELHLEEQLLDGLLHLPLQKRIIGVSANPVPGIRGGVYRGRHPVKLIEVPNSVINDHVPDYEYRYLSRGLDDYLRNGSFEKLVIFLHSKEHYKRPLFAELEGTNGGAAIDSGKISVYKFHSSLKPVQKFHEDPGRAILLTTYKLMAVGHNLLVGEAIFDEPDHLPYQTLYQVASRFLRVTNEHEKVVFQIVTRRPILIRMRLLLVELKRKENIEFNEWLGYQRIRNHLIEKVLTRLGVDPWQLEPLEFVWMLFIGTKSKELNQLFKQHGFDKDPRASILRSYYYNK